jgi:hypothetical protein
VRSKKDEKECKQKKKNENKRRIKRGREKRKKGNDQWSTWRVSAKIPA